MQEELTFDRPISDRRQEELIRQHCYGLEERIRTAPSRTDAKQIVEETCGQFDRTCESEIVRAFLKEHVRNLFKKAWNG